MGLLSKASNLDLSNKLVFTNFIKINNIKTCAIFENTNDLFVIKNSIGFDVKSICSSESTVDFWNGICNKTNTVYKFAKSDNSLNCLQQFFSYSMNEKIEFISIYKSVENKILLLINSDIDSAIITDFLSLNNDEITICNIGNFSISDNSKAFVYELSLCALLNDLNEKFHNSIINELYNRISCKYFDNILIIKTPEMNIRFCINQESNSNENIIIKHLELTLNEILDTTSGKIKTSLITSTTELSNLEEFFKVEK